MANNLKDIYWGMILKMIEKTPNDQELGKKLRKLFMDIPDRFKEIK